ncbi:ABC transporter substrate-binding protein [Methanolacinia paynteri]|uniref:ABC transporter substrate-binding protein n=1 Tax=Methanolacinia paynteri TaxID=230356 RepID=UPI001B80718D|nr:ABC transporter substrate-binding protein [Methanolacinia paynteri]
MRTHFGYHIFIVLCVFLAFFSGIAAAEETRTFVDDVGRELILPVNITAVSPSGPLAQIVLYSVDPDLFVSISSKYSDAQLKYIDPRVAALPVTGQFYGAKSTMNPEEIMEMNKQLGIDLVLDIGEAKSTMKEDLDKIQAQTGVNFAFVTQNNLSDIPGSYLTLGELLSEEEQCEKLSTYTSDLLSEFASGMNEIGDNKKSMIYVVSIDGNSVYLIGSGENSYHGEVINYISDNLANEAVTSSGMGDEYTMEDILQMNPDYIIVAYNADHEYYDTIMNSADWQSLRAVQDGNVYEAPYGPYSWMGSPPSVNRLLSMIWLGNLYYPDVFDYNVDDRVKEYYSLFYHYDLTDDDLSELMEYAKPAGSSSLGSATSTGTSAYANQSPAPLFALMAGLGLAVLIKRRNH